MTPLRAAWILASLLSTSACGDDGSPADTDTRGTTGSSSGQTTSSGGPTGSGSGSSSGSSSGGDSSVGTSSSSSSGPPADSSGTDTGGDAACSTPDECGGATPACDAEAGTCTGCTSDDDCGQIFCDVATGSCRDCVTEEHCEPNAPVCDPVSGQCTALCESNLDCATTGGPSVCNPELGVCTDCIGNGMPCQYCELDTYSCVGCLEDADCPVIAPFCGPSFECSDTCRTDDDCLGGLHCDPVTSLCAECVTNEHCPGEICQENLTCG